METYEIERTWYSNGVEFVVRLAMAFILPFKFKPTNTYSKKVTLR